MSTKPELGTPPERWSPALFYQAEVDALAALREHFVAANNAATIMRAVTIYARLAQLDGEGYSLAYAHGKSGAPIDGDPMPAGLTDTAKGNPGRDSLKRWTVSGRAEDCERLAACQRWVSESGGEVVSWRATIRTVIVVVAGIIKNLGEGAELWAEREAKGAVEREAFALVLL